MKYLILTLALIFMSNVLISQQNIESNVKNTMEGGIIIPKFNTLASTFRYRRIVSNSFTIRAGFEIEYYQQKDEFFEDESANLGLKGTIVRSNSMYSILFGLAYHLKGDERLSPYIGLDLLGGYGSMKEDGINSDGYVFVNNYEIIRNEKNIRYGTRLFFGMDYLFYKNAFVGFETGLNFLTQNNYDRSQTITIAGNTVITYENNFKSSSLNTSGLIVRVGFRF